MSFAPVYSEHSRALILGTWPSPKSREMAFYYGHPQNRFWPMLAALTGEAVPAREDIEAKKGIILRHGLALWDTLESCTITGASDASIRDVVPNDIAALLQRVPIEAVFCNGATAYRIYTKYLQPVSGIAAIKLPSTSPANAACRPEKLREIWGEPDSMLSGFWGDRWEVDDSTNVIVYYAADEKIEYVKIDTDSAYDNNRAAVTIDGEVYYVVGDPIYFESEEIESMTFLEHAVPYIESKPEAGYYDPDLEMKYAKVDEGIVVLYMTEWYLCVPADTAISD